MYSETRTWELFHKDVHDRQLQDEERPLYVQLNWTKDLKEGRFLLRQVNDPTKLEFYAKDGKIQSFDKNTPKRLSKREKKELKKERKAAQLRGEVKAYDKVSSSNFTRTISNPENVLKRKRQQKQDQLEKFKHRPESGGAFKVYAHTTFPEVPYKTLLISINTNASEIVRESLDKFGAMKANPADYCLAKVVVPPGCSIDDYGKENFQEAILDEDEYPMDAVVRWPESRGELNFELKRKPSDHVPRLKRPGMNRMEDSFQNPNSIPLERLPYFLELNNDGTDIIDYKPKHYRLQSDVTEVGSQRDPPGSGPYLQFVAPDILPRHCVVAKMEGVVTLTPSCAEAAIYVVSERIFETTILQHGAVVQFGLQYTFRFCDPQVEDPDWEDRNKSHVETTFDADGSIETYGGKQEKVPDPNTEVLPLSLEFRDTGEDTFFDVVVRQVNGAQIYFKLAPTYALYLACRYRLSKLYRPEMGPTERAQRLSAFLNKMADIIDRTVEEESQVAGALTFWLANVSELLHFFMADRDIGGISQDAQDILHTCVQNTFRHLVRAMQLELNKNLSAFLDPSDEADVEKDLIAGKNEYALPFIHLSNPDGSKF
nr:afadin-like [Lytechinus pictus]